MGLNLSQVPSGTRIFIDSNILLYVFFKHPVYGKSCLAFIKRIEENDIAGFIDEFVLNEVFHKLMVTAIMNCHRCSPAEAIAFVKKTPEILRELPQLWEACEILETVNVKNISGPLFSESRVNAQIYNLLATDAVHVAAMRKENIIHLASNDTDFSRVDFLHLWRPEQDNSLF